MKATDLMIWDWVKVTDIDEWFFGIVCGIDRDNVLIVKPGLSVGYPYAEECIEPIPLTPEILEKNGWHKFQMYYRLGIDKQQYMEYYPLFRRLQRIYKHKDNKEEVVFTCGALSYVHTLQHALKLCGIDKTIEP